PRTMVDARTMNALSVTGSTDAPRSRCRRRDDGRTTRAPRAAAPPRSSGAGADSGAVGGARAPRALGLQQRERRESDGDGDDGHEPEGEADGEGGGARQAEGGEDQDLAALLDAHRGGHGEHDEADQRRERLDAERGDHVEAEAQPADQQEDLDDAATERAEMGCHRAGEIAG